VFENLLKIFSRNLIERLIQGSKQCSLCSLLWGFDKRPHQRLDEDTGEHTFEKAHVPKQFGVNNTRMQAV
jgi:hypothetical protein